MPPDRNSFYYFDEPSGREARPAWADVPAGIVSGIETLVKSRIIAAETLWGGFGPSAVFSATLASGKKIFIKGTHPGQDAHGAAMLRQETEAHRLIPCLKNIAPQILGVVEDGDEDGWMLGVFEHIDTLPVLPWTREKLEKVFLLLKPLHSCDVKELAAGFPQARTKNFTENFFKADRGWALLSRKPKKMERFLTLFENYGDGRAWFAQILPVFVAAAERGFSRREGILHTDLRSDNILFSEAGRALIADWPDFCFGPVTLDMTYFISCVAGESPFSPEELKNTYEEATGIALGKNDLLAALSVLSGYFADQACRAVPAKLPRLRWIQKNVLWSMLLWAASLSGTPLPPPFSGLRR